MLNKKCIITMRKTIKMGIWQLFVAFGCSGINMDHHAVSLQQQGFLFRWTTLKFIADGRIASLNVPNYTDCKNRSRSA